MQSESSAVRWSEVAGKAWTGVLATSALVVFLLISMQYWLSPVSFDGAMNLQVAQALADSKGYARFYDSWRLFPKEVQTNAPYVIPASVVFSTLGVSFFSAQIVSLIYAALFFIVVFWLVRPVSGSRWALLAVLLTMTVTDFGRFALNGYGEVPALAWCLLGIGLGCRAIEARSHRQMLLAGLCFGLSVLTKTVMLMPVGLSLVLLGLNCLLVADARKLLLSLMVGLVGVIVLFECWRLLVFGSFLDWQAWWSDQWTAVSAQAGVSDRFRDTDGTLAKIGVHADAFSDSVHLSFPSIYGLLILPVIGTVLVGHALIDRRIERGTALLMSTLLVIGLAYFAWWLAITPTQKAWYRRIFNGWLVFSMMAPLLMAYALTLKSAAFRRASVVALTIPLGLLLWSAVQSFSVKPDEVRGAGIASAVDFIAALPEGSRFYGYGWYSAPVMSLYADVRVHDLIQNKFRLSELGTEHYLLSDPNLRRSGHQELALEGLQAELVHDGGPWARIYRLNPDYAFSELEVDDQESIPVSVDFGVTAYGMVQGLFPEDGIGWKRVRPQARVLLQFDEGSTEFFLHGSVPNFEQLILSDNASFRIEMVVDDCVLPPLIVEAGGRFRYRESIDECHLRDRDLVWAEFRASGVRKGSYRQLSWRIDAVGFE